MPSLMPNKVKRVFLPVVALSVVFVCASKETVSPNQSEPISADRRRSQSELQAFLDEATAKGIPGIAAAVATREGVVWTGVDGKADLQTGAPVRPNMLFGIGSITKTFVMVVILQLAKEGGLDLTATAASLLGAVVEDIPTLTRQRSRSCSITLGACRAERTPRLGSATGKARRST